MQSYKAGRRSRIGFLEDWWTHPDPADTFWHDEDHHDSLDTYECPVLVQSGWYDLLLESSIGQYERLAARGADVRLTVGPWTHATFTTKGLGSVLAESADFLRAAYGLDPAVGQPLGSACSTPDPVRNNCSMRGRRRATPSTTISHPARCGLTRPDQDVVGDVVHLRPELADAPGRRRRCSNRGEVPSTTANSNAAPTSSRSTCRR